MSSQIIDYLSETSPSLTIAGLSPDVSWSKSEKRQLRSSSPTSISMQRATENPHSSFLRSQKSLKSVLETGKTQCIKKHVHWAVDVVDNQHKLPPNPRVNETPAPAAQHQVTTKMYRPSSVRSSYVLGDNAKSTPRRLTSSTLGMDLNPSHRAPKRTRVISSTQYLQSSQDLMITQLPWQSITSETEYQLWMSYAQQPQEFSPAPTRLQYGILPQAPEPPRRQRPPPAPRPARLPTPDLPDLMERPFCDCRNSYCSKRPGGPNRIANNNMYDQMNMAKKYISESRGY